jgi:3-dehydroquinate synthase
MPIERWIDLMGHDKKVRGGRIRLVLMQGLGRAVTTGDYDPAALQATLALAAGHG